VASRVSRHGVAAAFAAEDPAEYTGAVSRRRPCALFTEHRMTPAKFFLRYTAIPFVAIVLAAGWALNRESGEIDARQYAALAAAYPSFTPKLKREVADALRGGRLAKADYGTIMRDALEAGYVIDWPAAADDVGSERGRLLGVVDGDRPASQ
jgi:hypothetical protein